MSKPNIAVAEKVSNETEQKTKAALKALEEAHLAPFVLPKVDIVISPETLSAG